MRAKEKRISSTALTLMEMVISLAIMAIVFAAILPQFRNIQNSWASRQGVTEALQNGRVLADHLRINLSKAVRITAVSDPSLVNGFIEFEANDTIIYRYEMSPDGYVKYGPVGNLSDLAGPVTQLQFTCHDAMDMDTSITDLAKIRAVRVSTTISNNAEMGKDKTFKAFAFLYVNSQNGIVAGSPEIFGITTGNAPVLAKIDATHSLCAFTGAGDDGWAMVLNVDTVAMTVSNETPFEYDSATGINPSLVQINPGKYLCAYTGPQNDGWAVILNVNPSGWTITNGTPLEFETKDCQLSSLAQINVSDYLCVYTGPGSDGWAVILTVNLGAGTISKGTPFEFDTSKGNSIALQKLDSEHFLCTYQGWSSWIWAVVLTVDIPTKTITKETPFDLGLGYGDAPSLCQIDSNHFLCAYSGNISDGMAVVVAVNYSDWSIARGTPFQYNLPIGKVPELVQLYDDEHYLCAYQGDSSKLWANVLVVDKVTWYVSSESTVELSTWKALKPDLLKIDDSYSLCIYEDQVNKGWAQIIQAGGVSP